MVVLMIREQELVVHSLQRYSLKGSFFNLRTSWKCIAGRSVNSIHTPPDCFAFTLPESHFGIVGTCLLLFISDKNKDPSFLSFFEALLMTEADCKL